MIATNPVSFRIPYSLTQNDDYEYLIQRADGRIIVGGNRWRSPTMEENTTDDSEVNPVISQGLLDYLLESFPELHKERVEIEYQWTGIMGRNSFFAIQKLFKNYSIITRPHD